MPYVGGDNIPGRGIGALDTATNTDAPSSGLQAVLAQLRANGVQKIDANAIRNLVNENARPGGDPSANGPNLGPAVLNLRNAGIEDASPMPSGGGGGGRTSAAPTSSPGAPIAPKGSSDAAMGQPLPSQNGTPTPDGNSMLQSLAPLLVGAGAGAFPLGAFILNKMRGGAPDVAPVPGAGPRMLPAPEPQLRIAGPDTPSALPGPRAVPQVGGPNPGAPQIAAPAERPPIPMTSVPTGNPAIPLQDANVPRPALETAGVQLSPATPPPASPPSATSAAIDKAVPADAPVAPRARAKARRLRLRD